MKRDSMRKWQKKEGNGKEGKRKEDFKKHEKKTLRPTERKTPAQGEYHLEKGLVHIYTGDGKGKSSTVTGLAIRAAGANLKIAFFQFFKKPFTSEIKILRKINNIHFYSLASYYYESDYITAEEIKKLKADFAILWIKVLKIVAQNRYDVIIMDEILIALRDGFISEKHLLDFLKSRNGETEIILTGRHITDGLKNSADIITEMRMIKHPFPDIRARKGIDF